MNKEIKIRPAVPEDANQLAQLAERGMPGYPFESVYDPASLENEIRAGSNRIVAVNYDQLIVGTAVLGDGHMAEIKRVLVDPDHRSKGLGHSLTSYLKQEALNRGVIPWADVRADQIGMQKAAYAYDLRLKPSSVEAGKHVVYVHKNNSGPARESMVHMSSLKVPDIASDLYAWNPSYTRLLVDNLGDSLINHEKDDYKSRLYLPSASLVKQYIENNLDLNSIGYKKLNPDVLEISNEGAQCLIISPDASGFVDGQDAESIVALVDEGLSLGLQIVTTYLPMANVELINQLIGSGMTPSMVRPWQNSVYEEPRWEVGLRKTANEYGNSLHSINLDPWIYLEVMDVIKKIDRTINMWAGYSREDTSTWRGPI